MSALVHLRPGSRPGPDTVRHHSLVRSSKEEKESAMRRGTLGESGEVPVRLRAAHHRQQARHGSGTCSPPEYWAVAQALASLRPDHRAVLVETYFLGRSVAEAAATLGIPARTVKSRACYALKALKLALQEQGLAL
jgi:Sigma-70, region 4